jgi:type I restriction enzyme S subunit
LPVPPLPEQRRIVAKLDELRARSRKAREALDEVPALLDKLKQSVLAAAFRGDLTAEWRAAQPPGSVEPASVLLDRIRAERRKRWEQANPKKKYIEPEPVDTDGLPELPEGWCWASVEEVTEFVTSGSRGWGEFYAESGARFLRVGNLKHNTVELDLRDVAFVQPPDGAEGTRTRVLRDDVLVSITADVGMVGHVSGALGEAYINQHVALLRPVTCLHQRCFAYALVDPMGLQRVVREVQYGMTKASLSLVQVRSFPVPLPPSREAAVLTSLLDSALHGIDVQLKRLSHGQSDLNSLDQALLAKAFRGELVPQDPNDEPAEKLLARIKAEAGNPDPSSRSRKPKGATR